MKAAPERTRHIATATIGGLAIVLAVISSVSGNWLAALLALAIIPPLVAAGWWRPDENGAGTGEQATASSIHNAEAFNEFGVLLDSELMHVEEEIDRTNGMIHHAASDLSDNFHQLHELSVHLAGVIQENLGEGAGSSDQAALQEGVKKVLVALAGNQPEMEQAITASVRSLQFEDLSSQALSEARRSLDYLRKVAGILQQISDTGELAESIHQQHEIWARKRRKPVSQKNLDEGLTELF